MTQPKPEYLQLQANEDVASVRDRMSFIRGKRVLMIWPEKGTALTRKLDLILVQREARRRALQLAFVTHDAQVLQHAEELGISTFETIGASERQRWKRGRSKVFIQRAHKPETSPEPAELIDVASRVRNRRAMPALRTFVERLVVLFVLAVFIGAAAMIITPSATVSLALKAEDLFIETSLIADPALRDVDIDGRRIPATVLRATVQTSGVLPSTGTSRQPDVPAIGVAVFENNTVRVVTIPVGTRVSTSAGVPITFETIQEVRIPGGVGQRAEVAIQAIAESAGSVGNVGAGMINTVQGDLAEQITVRNLSATTGGESREFRVVTAEDRDRLLAIARGQLQAAAYEEIRSKLSEGQLIVIETIRIVEERNDWTRFSYEAGEASDTLALEMRAIVEALAIDDRFARQVIFALLSASKPVGLVLQADSLTYTRGTVQEIRPNGEIVFSASGTASASPAINAVALQEQLAGKTINEALAILAQQIILGDTLPIIEVEPENFGRMPFLPFRIRILTAEAVQSLP